MTTIHFKGYFLLFKNFINSIKIIETKVRITIISIMFQVNGVVLKTVSKNGTYTINNCRITVPIIAPHMPRLANRSDDNRK